jgi:dTDP-4-amino-4,6-dideoxygalactose transaminase
MIKLKYLDEYINDRRKAADFYDKAFAGEEKIKTPFRASYSNHVFHQYTIQVDGVNRNDLNTFLSEQNIPSMIYYPVPGHRQKMFEHFNTSALDLPVTDWLTQRVISLPMHTELDEEQLNYISDKVLEFVNR